VPFLGIPTGSSSGVPREFLDEFEVVEVTIKFRGVLNFANRSSFLGISKRFCLFSFFAGA
jgi:hypothetical protein